MSKVAHYLQEHLVGEVMTSTDARRYFATDGSILQLAPALVAYPRNENDVRKTARFSWQLAERGRIIPITARGSGTDQTGAAIGKGILLVFTAHMNRVLELDTKANIVTVEPGINYGKLQQTLHSHHRFMPPYPASLEYSTVGGALANNKSGERSVKYGDTRSYVHSMRVVLANGEVIETGRLSKREVNKKMGLATFEGEIYRSLDALFDENVEILQQLQRSVPRNNAGYNLLDVRQKDGSVDLTPLFIGSQGTLGIITEAVLATESFDPRTTLLFAQFDSLENMQSALEALLQLPAVPGAIEMIDGGVLAQVHALNPNQLRGVVEKPFPAYSLLVEFEESDRNAKKSVRKAQKIFDQFATGLQTETEPEQQQQLWKLRQATSTLVAHNDGQKRAVPLLDTAVPVDRVREYIEGLRALLEQLGIPVALWGHVGDGSVQLQPHLDLAQVGDRQKAFRIIEEAQHLAVSMGGTMSALAGDGRLRTPYLERMYGAEVYALLQKVKKIFDPYGTLNAGVKFDTTTEDLKAMLRPDFGLEHVYDHLPRS